MHPGTTAGTPATAPTAKASTRRQTAGWLAGSLLLLLLGITAELHPDGAHWAGVRGPRCPLGTWLDPVYCPTCGMVRSTAAALQGRFAFAWQAHPAGLVSAALLLVACLWHAALLLGWRPGPRAIALHRGFVPCLLAAVALGWLWRFLTH